MSKQQLIDDINRALNSDGDWATLAERFEDVLEDCLEYLTEGTVARYETQEQAEPKTVEQGPIEVITSEDASAIFDSAEHNDGKYEPLGKFLVEHDKGGYSAIDNSTGDAWTEDFTHREVAEYWLRNASMDVEDAYTIDRIMERNTKALKEYDEMGMEYVDLQVKFTVYMLNSEHKYVNVPCILHELEVYEEDGLDDGEVGHAIISIEGREPYDFYSLFGHGDPDESDNPDDCYICLPEYQLEEDAPKHNTFIEVYYKDLAWRIKA